MQVEIENLDKIVEGLSVAGLNSSGIQTTGSPDWHRLFITHKGISVGRFSFHYGKLYVLKKYGSNFLEDRYPYKDGDKALIVFQRYMDDGFLLEDKHFARLHLAADIKRKLDIEKKLRWREENPNTRKRKRIHGPRLGRLVLNMALQLSAEELEALE
jgi:hypothetical protein